MRERERDTVISDRRTERGPKVPDFLREDYGQSQAGPLVIRNERREEDTYSRAPTRRRSLETVRSRAPDRVEEDRIVIRERDRGTPSRGERDEEIVFRERDRARSRPPPPRERENIDIDINIDRDARSRAPPARSEAPSRSEVRERDVEEIRFRRGGGERPPPPRTEVDREEIRFTERRSPPPRSEYRGRDKEEIDIDINLGERSRPPPPRSEYRGRDKEEIDIDINLRERSRPPPPRERSMSRGALVAKEREEWIIRRKRESPPPPPRNYEKEEIIIRRRERTPSPEPEPPREPTPEPPPPPPPEPIIRPPIIQEVITHHRHIDHGVERARSPTPSPPPAPPSPPPPPAREENLEVEIHRQGMRNGRAYDEDIDIKFEREERPNRELARRQRSVSASTRRRSPSAGPIRRRYDDDVMAEADYYNRKVRERAYPGEAYNGATRDWGLVDIPPGTERVRMDGVGGGRQDIYWERYNGERKGKFYTGDRVYESEYGDGLPAPAPPPAPLPPPPAKEEIDIDINISRDERRRAAPPKREEEIRITERRITEETSRGKTKDKMWTEITKDLVIKEAIEEMGYSYEETDEFFYVIEYLRYVSLLAQ